MRNIIAGSLLGVCLLGSSIAAQQADSEAARKLLLRSADLYEAAKSYSADIKLTGDGVGFGLGEMANKPGKLLVQRPRKMKLLLLSEAGETDLEVIADGETGFAANRLRQQLAKFELGDTLSKTPFFKETAGLGTSVFTVFADPGTLRDIAINAKDLKLGKDEKIDGVICRQVSFRDDRKTTIIAIGKEDGLIRRVEARIGPVDAPTSRILEIHHNIKLNEKFGITEFEFDASRGFTEVEKLGGMPVVKGEKIEGLPPAKLTDMPGDFLAKTPEGVEYSLSQFKGKAVVLQFWGYWCSYCKKEMPLVSGLHKELQDNPKVQFIAAEFGDPPGVGRQYFQENGFGMLLLQPEQEVTQKWDVEGFPTIVIIGPDGKEAKRLVGYHTDVASQIKQALRDLGVLK